MKILYGVQGTGQGHISRARAMAAAFQHTRAEITWLFSGRPRDRLYDMQPFGNFLHYRGLSFTTRSGRIDPPATVADNNLFEFARDAWRLPVDDYDLIVTDFEPVTAWAARRAGRQCIGIGHQYAFAGGQTPRAGESWASRQVMRWFAPVSQALGLHWQPYGSNVLPPILDLPALPVERGDYILVYLPFEDQDAITRWLQSSRGQRFVQYAPGLARARVNNVERYPANTHGFKRHLAGAGGVICNSGFELISECLQWHKPVLTRPLKGQFEQQSNALALQQMGAATVVQDLTTLALHQWLTQRPEPPANYFPDVAAALAHWLAEGAEQSPDLVGSSLWHGHQPPLPVRTHKLQQLSPLYHGRPTQAANHQQHSF